MRNRQTGNAFVVPLLAVLILAALSFIDWHRLSQGRFSNFNLIEDVTIRHETDLMAEGASDGSGDFIDPELKEAVAEVATLEVTSEEELPMMNFHNSTNPQGSAAVGSGQTGAENAEIVITPITVERIGGVLPIEDYTPDGHGLRRLKDAIADRSNRRARIAFLGDSYIEGDIFTQDVRRLLQNEYGGRGVGYMSMHSDFPGFRRSVNQSDKGWTVRDLRNHASDPLKPLSGEYSVSSGGATTTFKGAKLDNTQNWGVSRLLFISPRAGAFTLTTDAGSQRCEFDGSEDVQMIELDDDIARLTISTDTEGVKILGTWLEDDNGVGVDCMSLRGNSGISLRSLSTSLADDMRQYVPYDLIILEYGLNALSASQSDYRQYAKLMAAAIDRIKECYPDADILMLGVGDRGHKKNTEVTSIPTVEAMVSAQRACAQKSGILFWDTRQAMGGENSIVDWRDRGLVNADYIHLNHKGGAVLAEEFFNALKMKINE